MTSADIKSRTAGNGNIENVRTQASKLVVDTLTAAEVAAAAITACELADNAVDPAAIEDGAVTIVDVAAGAIDATAIAAGAVTSARPAPNSLTSTELVDNVVCAAAIQANAVMTSEIPEGLSGGTIVTFEVRHATATGTEGLFRVSENGDLDQLGTTLSGSQTFDIAEYFPTNSVLEPGDVVVAIDDPSTPGLVAKSFAPYQAAVVGVVTTNPGIILGGAFSDEVYFPDLCRAEREARAMGNVRTAAALRDQIRTSVRSLPRVAVALAGRVPVKVSTENGPIRVGDLLTTSSTPGHAMRYVPGATKGEGVIIGKALQSLDAGTGSILVLVSNS